MNHYTIISNINNSLRDNFLNLNGIHELTIIYTIIQFIQLYNYTIIQLYNYTIIQLYNYTFELNYILFT